MKISFKELLTANDADRLSVSFDARGAVVLVDPLEYRASTLLQRLVDIDADAADDILLDGIPKSEYYVSHHISETFGYVFDEGIMLSNLSIHENLLLPYRLRWGWDKQEVFDAEVQAWLLRFELQIDLDLRPAYIKPSRLKMLCFIRSLLLQPQILLIDNPYYLLNQIERQRIWRILTELKPTITLVIASIDSDFTEGFAQTLLVFDENNKISVNSTAIT